MATMKKFFPPIESAGVLDKAWKILPIYLIMVDKEGTNALITVRIIANFINFPQCYN